jgi:hypothetical protein
VSAVDVPAPEPRAIPLLGDVPLTVVEVLRHELDARFTPIAVTGLDGEVQQWAGRGGHRIHIRGALVGPDAHDDLAGLQAAAGSGEELDFSADITTSLDLTAVVITDLVAEAVAGHPDRIAYALWLAESPPLPPPAELGGIGGIGGLGGLGLGDLGFDTDILGELAGLADAVMAAVDDALDLVDALGALSGLADLTLDGVLEPLDGSIGKVAGAGQAFRRAADALGEVLGS